MQSRMILLPKYPRMCDPLLEHGELPRCYPCSQYEHILSQKLAIFKKEKHLFIFILCVCFSVCMAISVPHVCLVPKEAEECNGSSGNDPSGSEPCGCWELSLNLLPEQYTLNCRGTSPALMLFSSSSWLKCR